MLERRVRRTAAFVSGTHCKSFQSLLVLWLALSCSTETKLRASSDPSYGHIPLTFIANRGQTHHSVRFTAKGPGLTAYFTPGEVVVDLRGSTVRMRYVGANLSPAVDGLEIQEGRANFLIGNDPAEWRINVPLYGGVAYKSLYPGVDMIYSSHKRLLKSEFVVAPDADPSEIQIEYTGVESLRVDHDGSLVFKTEAGELREEAPEIYQESLTGRDVVKGAFRVSGNIVSFFVENYDRSRPLRIDPVLSYSTYLGGSGTERAHAIALDPTGAAYVTGYTDSANFPTTAGALRTTFAGSVDAFVTKLNAAGNAIVYSTYLGGNGDDRGHSIIVNTGGNAFITGYTSSSDFPVAGPVQSSNGGGRDVFISKLNTAGTGLTYSTYLGGLANDQGNGIAIDSTGSAYITGSTSSANFPVVGPFQLGLAGGQDGFVTKLNTAGSGIAYSTYLGGTFDDRGSSIAVDSSGAAYIAGNTLSTNFPVLSALQGTKAGAQDAFVTKLNSTGVSLAYSTYLGGAGTENVEVGRSIVVSSSNNAYVTGSTSSVNFPVFLPLQPASSGGGNDAFVVKLTTAGTAFSYSTYLGGASMDLGASIAVDSAGSAYIAGYTASPDFPTVSAGQGSNGGNYDAFVTKLNAAGSALAESGFLGGSAADSGYGIAIDASGNAFLTGQTSSSDFPLLGPIQTTNGSTLAAFVARFTFGAALPPSAVSVTPSSGTGSSQVFELVYTDPRGYTNISWVEMNWNTTQATANACYLRYDLVNNVIQLATDAGSAWVGSATPGIAGVLENNQCSLNSSASSVSGSGNNLVINLSLTFKPAFAGDKTIYMEVQNITAQLTPWQSKGSWTIPSPAPANVSVSPASGTGTAQTFSFIYSDSQGFADIAYVDMLFQAQLVGQNACFVQYVRASNLIWLISDAGSSYIGPVTLGTAGTVTNSQCTVNAGTSTVSASGNNLTVNLAITFKPAFPGAKNVYMGAVGNSGVFSGWQPKGVWTIPGAPPTNVSVTPSSGSGTTQSFSFLFSDPIGFADIHHVDIIFNSQLVGQNGCFIEYSRASNVLYMVADSGSGFVGSATLGTVGTLTNSQCTVNTGTSTAQGTGNNLTVTLAITFKPAFFGTKNAYMSVANNSGVFVGWDARGTWTAPQDQLPTTVSVTPSSGSGAAQAFTAIYSDVYGYTDIRYVNLLFNSALVAANGCWVQYSRVSNLFLLLNDSGVGFAGSAAPGTAGTLTNTQCIVNTGTSSVSGTGTNLTITVAITFKPAFAGAKTSYLSVVNMPNAFSGWDARGTWTVP